jgi:hypothetical protein
MAKYHVKSNGDTGICTASEGNCPFAADGAVHFNSIKEAHFYAEGVIAKIEGGSFASAGHSLNIEKFDFGINNPEAYTVKWDEALDLGKYLEPGETFCYKGTVYIADNWIRYHKFGALGVSTINAISWRSGEKQKIEIWTSDQASVSFLNKNFVTLPNGESVPLTDLPSKTAEDKKLREMLIRKFRDSDPSRLFVVPARDAGLSSLTTDGDRNYYLALGSINFGGREVWAITFSPGRRQDENPNEVWSSMVTSGVTYYASEEQANAAYDARKADFRKG